MKFQITNIGGIDFLSCKGEWVIRLDQIISVEFGEEFCGKGYIGQLSYRRGDRITVYSWKVEDYDVVRELEALFRQPVDGEQ